MNLRPEELKLLEDSKRCECCDHLEALHNYHCCISCHVNGCGCKWSDYEYSDEYKNDSEYQTRLAKAKAQLIEIRDIK